MEGTTGSSQPGKKLERWLWWVPSSAEVRSSACKGAFIPGSNEHTLGASEGQLPSCYMGKRYGEGGGIECLLNTSYSVFDGYSDWFLRPHKGVEGIHMWGSTEMDEDSPVCL